MNERQTAAQCVMMSDFHIPASKKMTKDLQDHLQALITRMQDVSFQFGDFMEFDTVITKNRANEDLFVLRQEVKNAITKAGATC